MLLECLQEVSDGCNDHFKTNQQALYLVSNVIRCPIKVGIKIGLVLLSALLDIPFPAYELLIGFKRLGLISNNPPMTALCRNAIFESMS